MHAQSNHCSAAVSPKNPVPPTEETFSVTKSASRFCNSFQVKWEASSSVATTNHKYKLNIQARTTP